MGWGLQRAMGDRGSLGLQITATPMQGFSGFDCASQALLFENGLCQNLEIAIANYLRLAEKKAVIPVTRGFSVPL